MTDRKTREYYCERAPEYEQIYYREVPQRRVELKAEVQRLEKLAAGKNVLELACGSGYWTEKIARSAKSLVAVDCSSEMLAEAKKKQYKIKVEFIRDDLYNLAINNCSFDLVALGFWFSHHPKCSYDELFSILASKLSESGIIWMIDNNPPAEGDNFDSINADPVNDNYKTRLLSDKREYRIIKNYFNKDELRRIISPFFGIRSLIYNKYYWSITLRRHASG